jgi:hypothetical protein
VQVGVDLLRKYNTILTLPTPTAPVRCGQLRTGCIPAAGQL